MCCFTSPQTKVISPNEGAGRSGPMGTTTRTIASVAFLHLPTTIAALAAALSVDDLIIDGEQLACASDQ